MGKNKTFHIVSAILLMMIANTAVNFSDNLYMGIRHPELYFFIVIPGLIISTTIQFYGAYKLLDKVIKC